MNNKLVFFLIITILIFFIFSFLNFGNIKVTSHSMNDTLVDGQKVIYKKITSINQIGRNDVILFSYKNQIFIKRCIALPNDIIEINNGKVFINETPFIEVSTIVPSSGIKYLTQQSNTNFRKMRIPNKDKIIEKNESYFFLDSMIIEKFEGDMLDCLKEYDISKKSSADLCKFKNDYFFVLGDNRPNSLDSRNFGPIPFKSILGKVLFY